MRRAEEQLSELLHQATAQVTGGVHFEDVARRARRHRRFAAGAAAVAVAALTAGAVTAGTALTGHGQDRPAAARNHHATSVSRHRRLAFEGAVFTLPRGWTTTTWPGCGWPASNTVVINYQTGPALYCPAPHQPTSLPTSVTLTTIYGPQYADSWTGQRTTWHGQPAWLAVQTQQGVTTIRLTLPWLNTAVTAESPYRARARALLRQLSARPGSGLEVPGDASSVFIQSLAGRDGDSQQRNATITGASDVRRVLADLRSLRPAKSNQAACDGSWWPDTALLTVQPSDGPARTYAAQFGSCSQVIAGTGAAATVSGHLLADIKRLVHNSGL
jgi:hypothetical protein